jgi:hypothetical protein
MPASTLRRISKRAICLLVVAVTSLKTLGIELPLYQIAEISSVQAADRPAKPAPKPSGTKTAKPKTEKNDDQAAAEGDKPSQVFVAPVKLPTQKIKLADGIKVEVDEYGDTYQGYNFRPPLECRDWDLLDRRDRTKGYATTDPAIETIYDSSQSKIVAKGLMHQLAIDGVDQKLYFSSESISGDQARIYRMNCDGSQLEQIAEGLRLVREMAIDHKGHKVYFVAAHDLRRMNLTGSQLENVATDLDDLRGIALDPEAGHIYFTSLSSTHSRIFRSNLDGTNRIVFLENQQGNQLRWDRIHHKLYWNKTHVNTGKQISRCDLDGGRVEHLLDKGSSNWFGGISGLEIDPAQQKLYILNADDGCIVRMNYDASQPEELVFGNPKGGALALDVNHEYLYWYQYLMVNKTIVERIRRTKTPPVLATVEKPAPPLIIECNTYQSTPNDRITVTGRSMKDVSQVAVIGVGTGEYLEAKHRVLSGTSLEVVIPQLEEACSEVALVVQGPGGVTVTLPRSSSTYDPSQTQDLGPRNFDAWAKNQKFSLVINPPCLVSDVEHCIAYVAPKAYISVRKRGESVVFLKNGAAASGFGLKRSVLFYEPFAVVQGRQKIPSETRLIPVPAIRPSFLDHLLKYEGIATKP